MYDHAVQGEGKLSPVAVGEAVDGLIYLLTAVAERRRLKNGMEVCKRLIRPPRRASDGSYFVLDTLEQLPLELLDQRRVEQLHGGASTACTTGRHRHTKPNYRRSSRGQVS